MHKRLLNDARHWFDRAEEARTIADTFKDEAARAAMHRIADDYDRLARAAQDRLLTLPPNYGRGATLPEHESAAESVVLSVNSHLRSVK